MQMFTNAEIRKGADEVKGDYISYDAVTEFYQVIGGPSVASTGNPKGRVRATIQPPAQDYGQARWRRPRKPDGTPETLRPICASRRSMMRLRSSPAPVLPISMTRP